MGRRGRFEVIVRRPGFSGSYAHGPFSAKGAAEVVALLSLLTFPPDRYQVRRVHPPKRR